MRCGTMWWTSRRYLDGPRPDFATLGATSFKVPLGEDGSFSVEVEPADYVVLMDNWSYNGCNDAFHMEKQSAPVRRSPSFWTSTPVSVLRNNLKVSESS